MSRRGRPRNSTQSIRIVLSGWLHPENDADIIAWLNAIAKGQRIHALKTALRSGGLGLETIFKNGDPDEIQTAADDLLANWEY